MANFITAQQACENTAVGKIEGKVGKYYNKYRTKINKAIRKASNAGLPDLFMPILGICNPAKYMALQQIIGELKELGYKAWASIMDEGVFIKWEEREPV